MRNLILLLCALLWSGVVWAGDDENKSTLSADQLYSEYDSNELAADAKYKGKKIIINGTIQNISSDIQGHPYIVIGTELFEGVQCSFPDSRKSSLMHLTKGQQVKVKGTVQGMTMHVQLDNSTLIEK